MKCAWKELMDILPPGLRRDVDAQGREDLEELRLRLGQPPELVLGSVSRWLPRTVCREDLQFVVNAASRYSPWMAETIGRGYLTAKGGHRIGLCGTAVNREGHMTGIREVYSLCIRVARDYSGIAGKRSSWKGSVLILGAPGWGKTTLLRDLIRLLSEDRQISVVDEREELFPEGLQRGKRMDVLSGCRKPEGIEAVLRSMGPDCIAVDEITAEEDCHAMVQAANCGVTLLATAHAASRKDLQTRPVYQPLVKAGIFETVAILHKDRSYDLERMGLWATNGSGRY